MKKLKLLSSLSALLLVLSVGACDRNVTEDSSSDEVTSSESDSSSSESTPAPVELSNYTISITLLDEEGNTVAIPFYDSVYIQGSWDSWAEWVPLTNIGTDDEPILTTTFATIEEGTYEFKGLVGLTDSGDPTWESEDWIELIVAEDGKSNATFTVNAEDGDNYTNNLKFTVDATKVPVLDETPMTDEEIAQAILNVAYVEEAWPAIYGEHYDESDDSFQVIYVTTDSDDVLYGVIREYDDYYPDDGLVAASLNSEYFYVDGVEYTHNLNSSNYSTEDEEDYFNFGDYDDLYDDFAVGLTTLSYIESVSDLASWSIIHEDGSSLYTLSVVNTTTDNLICRRAGDAFTIVRAEEIDNTNVLAEESYAAEPTTAATIEAQMSEFSRWDWDVAAENPSELVEKAALTCNFSVEFEWIEYESANPMSYSDYNRLLALDTYLYYYIDPDSGESLVDEDGNWVEGGQERFAALYNEYLELYAKYENIYEEFSIDQYYLSKAYYAEDYMVYDCYTIDEDGDTVLYYELIYVVDDDGTMWEYFTKDQEEWEVEPSDVYHWSDTTYSLLDEYYTYNSASHLEYQGSGTTDDGSTYDVYDFDDWSFSWSSLSYVSQASAYWFMCLGGWDMFGTNAYSYGLNTFTHYYTYFFPEEQIMQSIYSYGGTYSSDRNYDENTTVFYAGDEVYITVYDVNSTDASEAVNNAIQANINA